MAINPSAKVNYDKKQGFNLEIPATGKTPHSFYSPGTIPPEYKDFYLREVQRIQGLPQLPRGTPISSTPTGKFALTSQSTNQPLTSSQINGQPAQASASLQPNLQPELTQPKVESEPYLYATTSPGSVINPETNQPPSSNLISPETGQLKSKPSPYKVAAQKLIDGGMTEIKTPGEARAIIDANIPSTTGLDKATNFLQTDEFFTNLLKEYQNFISPQSQKTSLKETYSQLIKESGIEQLNLDAINLKNVIEGTESDIRREITASGGFASESQILGLSSVRNRELIKQYNMLLEIKASKEKYLSTLINLEQADRQAADAKFEQGFNMATQIEDYRQKMKRNAIESFDRIVNTIGWSGLSQSVSSYEAGLIERAYSLPSGGLATAANQERILKAQEEEKRLLEIEKGQLDIRLKESALTTDELQRQKLVADIQKSLTTPSGKPISSATALQIADSEASVGMLEELDSTIRNNKNLFGPIKGRLLALSPYATETQSVQSTINSTKQIVGKFLEGGVLRKEDEAKYEKILPKLSDTSEVAMRKLANVRNLVELKIASQRDILEAAGYNPAIPSSDIIIGPDGLEYEITN